MTTQAQAESVAAVMLAGCLGRTEQLTWSALVHPGLEPLDVVAVETEDGSLRSYVLDKLTIPLTPAEAMSATARDVTVAY